jgi:hypothetical protein
MCRRPTSTKKNFPTRCENACRCWFGCATSGNRCPLPACRPSASAVWNKRLSNWVDDQRYPGVDGALVLAHLAHGSALLMLDGVDEVPPVHQDGDRPWYPREMLLTGLSEAVARWTKAGNRLLVTSRPYGLDGHQQQRLGLPAVPILGLDPPLQALLVRRWFVRLKEGVNLGLETAAAMIDHLHVERGLDDLADNPLLLTAMCIIFDQGKRLPHDKYLLYDKIIDTVLHKRYPARNASARSAAGWPRSLWGCTRATAWGSGAKRPKPARRWANWTCCWSRTSNWTARPIAG